MSVYEKDGAILNLIYDNLGLPLDNAYNLLGEQIYPDGQQEKHHLESYNIFVPQNVSDEWNTGAPSGKTLNVSTTQFLGLFYDGYLTNPPQGLTVTKKSIGKDQTGQYDMFEFDFKPRNYERTILLSSGMHTYELSASFGLANFINNLYSSENDSNEAFQYIRKYVRIKVIPVVNPWGFNQSPKKYGNANGVNPNRGFDLDGQWDKFDVLTPAQNEWNVKGEYPFSEAEVINLAKWVDSNWGAEFWIDCHTGAGYSDSDLWLYYSSDSVILNGINASISNIESWFKDTYGVDCVTKRTVDNRDSIRLHWAEKCMQIAGYTQEQSPGRTTFGTANNNDSGDISNYSTVVSTFIQEFLLAKYESDVVIPITNATNPNSVSIDVSTGSYSATIESTISPSDTTQNKFKWVSSNESVVKVYGGSNKAIVVGVGNGTAVVTGTNRYDSNIVINSNVSVTGYALPNAMDLPCELGAIDYTDGNESESANRLRTGYIDISGRTWKSAFTVRDMSISGVSPQIAIRLYDSNHEYLGNLNATKWSGDKADGWGIGNGSFYDTDILPTAHYARLVFRKGDNSTISSASGYFRIRNTTYSFSL